MDTKVGADIPIRKTYLCVLLCIWKCMYAFMYVESLGLLPKSANSAEGNLSCPPGRAVGTHWGITSTWIAACSSRTCPHIPAGVKAAPAPQQSSPGQGKGTYRSDLQVFCRWIEQISLPIQVRQTRRKISSLHTTNMTEKM